MTKTTMLMTVAALVCGAATANAQVYVQPVNYAYASNGYTMSQPVYAPAASPAYAPVTSYYAGNACGQIIPCSYNCTPCGCNTYAANYASASPYVPQAVYSPVTYAPAPAPAPVACGPQAYIRRGLLGQPTVFVPGQPIRNLFRFLTP